MRHVLTPRRRRKAARSAPAPQPPLMFWLEPDGSFLPAWPFENTGEPRVADGVELFTLEQATARSVARQTRILTNSWRAAWGELERHRKEQVTP